MRCKGKQSYETAAIAESILQSIRRNRHKRDKTPVRHYQCPDCGKHHLTSRPYATEEVKLIHNEAFRKYL